LERRANARDVRTEARSPDCAWFVSQASARFPSCGGRFFLPRITRHYEKSRHRSGLQTFRAPSQRLSSGIAHDDEMRESEASTVFST